jgi:hypothetical protein
MEHAIPVVHKQMTLSALHALRRRANKYCNTIANIVLYPVFIHPVEAEVKKQLIHSTRNNPRPDISSPGPKLEKSRNAATAYTLTSPINSSQTWSPHVSHPYCTWNGSIPSHAET